MRQLINMYLKWNTKTITDLTESNINTLYNQGFLFTRTGRGQMYQTRSLRVDLSNFILSSENKRILKKTANIQMQVAVLPYQNYHWSIHKMGKDFYTIKFGDKTFSANKIKELMTDKTKSNFNWLFIYQDAKAESQNAIGYCLATQTNQLIHYCYPFYDLDRSPKDMGLGMMLRAILYSQNNNKEYIYLGSYSRPTDTYKLRFKGLEWFDRTNWQTDLNQLKTT